MQFDMGSLGAKKILRYPYRALHRFMPHTAEKLKTGLLDAYGRYQEKKLYPKVHQAEAGTIYADVTVVGNHDYNTGIQRVVNSVATQLHTLRAPGTVCFTQLHRNSLMTTCSSYDRKSFGCALQEDGRLNFQCGDILFLLDSPWDMTAAGRRAARRMHAAGGDVYGLVHDMFPVQYPEWFASQAFVDNFILWHEFLMREADGILCNSKSTAEQVAAYYKKHGLSRERPLELYVFPMGAELGRASVSPVKARQKLQDFMSAATTFLMVGTVEVRKGHAVALEAFRKLLESGEKAQLLIIGRDGWKNDSFKQAMSEPEIEGKVLWLDDADDGELEYAYRHAAALIAASKDEGFGLPLVEAAHYGIPIICSDIPIFHEVAGEHASYFCSTDSTALAGTLQHWLSQAEHPDSGRIRLYSWKESASYMLQVFSGQARPYQTLD